MMTSWISPLSCNARIRPQGLVCDADDADDGMARNLQARLIFILFENVVLLKKKTALNSVVLKDLSEIQSIYVNLLCIMLFYTIKTL